MTELATLIRSERLEFVAFLETLTPREWDVPSLCSEWTVQEVAAHLAGAPAQTGLATSFGLVRSRFSVNRAIASDAVRWSRRGTAAILEQLRVNATNGAKPIGVPSKATMADVVIHGLDIRRPLGRPRPIPAEAFVLTADLFAEMRWPLSIPIGGNARKHIDDFRLEASDFDWTRGQGPVVRASGEAILLALAGRPVGPEELQGPGAPQLYARLFGY